jgi:translation elongation factor EF-Ts
MPPVAAGLDEPEENPKKHTLRQHGCVAVFIDAMVELNCQSEFTARAEHVVKLAVDIAKQIAATTPRFISRDKDPGNLDVEAIPRPDAYLLEQRLIYEPGTTIKERIEQLSLELNDDICVRRFICFKPGELNISSERG